MRHAVTVMLAVIALAGCLIDVDREPTDVELETVEQREACMTCGGGEDGTGGDWTTISPTSSQAQPVAAPVSSYEQPGLAYVDANYADARRDIIKQCQIRYGGTHFEIQCCVVVAISWAVGWQTACCLLSTPYGGVPSAPSCAMTGNLVFL